MKNLFIGGMTSSGTTLVYKTIMLLDFAISTAPYEEGQKDPDHPPIMNSFVPEEFLEKDKVKVRNWIESFYKPGLKDWFVEKSPGHFGCFGALQDLYGDNAYFILVQRDPFQRAASKLRRWGPSSDEETLNIKRLNKIIKSHNEVFPNINKILYVRYEDFCKNTEIELYKIVKFLNLNILNDAIDSLCSELDLEIRREYDKPVLSKESDRLCREIAELWNYKYMEG